MTCNAMQKGFLISWEETLIRICYLTKCQTSYLKAKEDFCINPIALRTAKTLWSFDRSDCNRVKNSAKVSEWNIEVKNMRFYYPAAAVIKRYAQSDYVPSTVHHSNILINKTCHRDRTAHLSAPCPSHKKLQRKNFNVLLTPTWHQCGG